MKILLVYPGGRGTLPFGIPLGIASIAAVLRESGHEVSIVDFRFQNETTMRETIRNGDPGVIGFYASTDLANFVLKLGEAARSESSKACLVVGGPHATIDPAYFLAGRFDVVVMGEGEATARELVANLDTGGPLSSVRGIAWRDGASIVENESRPFIEDLDSLPFPAYDLFPYVNQTLNSNLFWSNLLPFTHVLVSRGCPFSCSFCQPTLDRMFGKKVRRMSPRRVLELLRFLKRGFGVKEVFFEDDLFLSTAFKGWLSELMELLRNADLGIRWWAQARADSTDRELLSLAKSAGCYMVMCGVESGSQRVLDFYNKRTTVSQVRTLFRTCRELGLLAVAEIIYGAPIETEEDVAQTLRLLREIRPDGVSPCVLSPYPGTYVCDWLSEHNVKFNTALDRLDRSVHEKRIESALSAAFLRKLALSTTLTTPSIRLVLTRGYYRRVYFDKLSNLVRSRNIAKAFFLVLLSVPKPILRVLIDIYFRLGEKVPFVVKLKNIIKH
jgi:anaerobic magnesium-protoporphyrin IX monomethyl ester cyclase